MEGREAVVASRYLADRTGLSRAAVKDAMLKGACLVRPAPSRTGRRKSTARRLRRGSSLLYPGDGVEFHHDPALLALEPATAELLAEEPGFTVWNKPAGLLSQGNEWGDHCSLLRQAERYLGPKRRQPYLVHRLDREVAGLVLVATTRSASSALSAMFRRGEVEKSYRAEVPGNLEEILGPAGTLDADLDGRRCRTGYRVAGYDREAGLTRLDLQLVTGRRHQIRRHLAMAGFPVLGDPRYGTGNKAPGGIRLAATGLAFRDPGTGAARAYRISAAYEGRSSG